MTVRQLADYLNLNERTVLKLVSEGELPGVKIGNQWRFRKAMLITDLDTSRFAQPPTGGAGDTGGALWIDVSLATSVTIWTIQRPYV